MHALMTLLTHAQGSAAEFYTPEDMVKKRMMAISSSSGFSLAVPAPRVCPEP